MNNIFYVRIITTRDNETQEIEHVSIFCRNSDFKTFLRRPYNLIAHGNNSDSLKWTFIQFYSIKYFIRQTLFKKSFQPVPLGRGIFHISRF